MRYMRTLLLWGLTLASVLAASARALPVQQHRRIEGTYLNLDYGYSATVPNGLFGDNLAPPAPQHGFGIDINGKSGGSILVDASYDSLFLGSVDAAANDQASSLRREHNLV